MVAKNGKEKDDGDRVGSKPGVTGEGDTPNRVIEDGYSDGEECAIADLLWTPEGCGEVNRVEADGDM